MKTIRRNFLPCAGWLLLAALLGLPLSGRLAAQDAAFIALVKEQGFFQADGRIVGLDDEGIFGSGDGPLGIAVFVEADTPGNVVSAGLVLPSPPGGVVALEDLDEPPLGEELEFQAAFETALELDTGFPDGTYTILVTGLNDSPPDRSASLTLADTGGGRYRGIPKFTTATFTAAQAINPALPFTFNWEPIPGGTLADFATLAIESDSGTVFESPDVGETGALNGTSTTITVPAGTLAPGERYEVRLGVFNIVGSDLVYTTALAAFGKSTSMEARTTGSDFSPPILFFSEPFEGRTQVGRNAVVLFRFSEPMDDTVAVAQAVDWTGVPDPAQFDYRWGPRRETLFCHYLPGLPASTTIGWQLNPSGSAATLRDAAGNPLLGSPAGSFATGTGGFPEPADAGPVLLFKARGFFQDGGGVASLDQWLAAFELRLNGVNAVPAVDLTLPGLGTSAGIGELDDGNLLLSGELEFAEKSDLDRIVPNGSYTLAFDGFNDGAQSVTLDLPADAYPAAPVIQNYAAAQAIDAGQDFTLQWSAWSGGGGGDTIFVSIDGENGQTFFESPAPGEAGALDGTATGILIPAGTLPPGRALEATVAFFKVVDSDTTQYPGVLSAAGYAAYTGLEMATAGEPFTPRLEIVDLSPGAATLRLTGELGRLYLLRSTNDLGLAPTLFWSGFPLNRTAGFQGAVEIVDATIGGVDRRFYQAEEIVQP